MKMGATGRRVTALLVLTLAGAACTATNEGASQGTNPPTQAVVDGGGQACAVGENCADGGSVEGCPVGETKCGATCCPDGKCSDGKCQSAQSNGDAGTCGGQAPVGACNDLAALPTPAAPTINCVDGPPPARSGGEIVPGTYVRTSLTVYHSQPQSYDNCANWTAPSNAASLLRICANLWEHYTPFASAKKKYVNVTVVDHSGGVLTANQTCPAIDASNNPICGKGSGDHEGDCEFDYTANGSELFVWIGDAARGEYSRYVRQP